MDKVAFFKKWPERKKVDESENKILKRQISLHRMHKKRMAA